MNIKNNQMTRNIIVILSLCFLSFIYFLIFYPGELTPDSQNQYQMAITGQYGDHHPFIMSFLWHYLDLIYTGSAPMLLWHHLLLWGGIYNLYRGLKHYNWSPLVFFTPFIPNIAVYAGHIWKDVGFAYSFFFVLSYMSYACLQKKNITYFNLFLLLLVLMYGTLVKFQAFYLAPIVLIWMAWHKSNYGPLKQIIKSIIPIGIIFYSLIKLIIFIGPEVKPDHAWQYVKLYDLAALSVETKQDLIPSKNKTPIFSIEELKKRFNHQRVDDLVFVEPIVQKGTNDEERSELYHTWLSQVIKHPIYYLKHRTQNLMYTLLSTIGFGIIKDNTNQISYLKTLPPQTIEMILRIPCFIFLAHALTILIGFFYWILSIYSYINNKNQLASIPLFFFNSIALSMVLILLFCSMAGTPRYTYISVLLINASHAFAFLCGRDLLKISRNKKAKQLA